ARGRRGWVRAPSVALDTVPVAAAGLLVRLRELAEAVPPLARRVFDNAAFGPAHPMPSPLGAEERPRVGRMRRERPGEEPDPTLPDLADQLTWYRGSVLRDGDEIALEAPAEEGGRVEPLAVRQARQRRVRDPQDGRDLLVRPCLVRVGTRRVAD